MSMTGELYRVTSVRLKELLANPDTVEDALYPEDPPANAEQCGYSVEKTWDAIEFTLLCLQQQGQYSDLSPLTDGDETGCELHYGPVWYRNEQDVKSIAKALSTVSIDMFQSVFSTKSMNEHSVYPGDWDEEDADADFEYVWQYFEDLIKFYEASAKQDAALLLHLA